MQASKLKSRVSHRPDIIAKPEGQCNRLDCSHKAIPVQSVLRHCQWWNNLPAAATRAGSPLSQNSSSL